ncbi:MAG TPA: hypothetical protein VFG29_12635, partial [Syntrophales bacterium]|nr:hypothetical protein [Syntrophales bacterium]
FLINSSAHGTFGKIPFHTLLQKVEVRLLGCSAVGGITLSLLSYTSKASMKGLTTLLEASL